MDSQDLRNLSEAYNCIYETIGTAKPQSQYSTKPGDGKPYKDGPLWGGPDDKPTPTAPKPATPTASTSLKPRNDVRNRDVNARGGFDPRFDRRPNPTTGTAPRPSTPTTTTAPKPSGPVAQAPKPSGLLGSLDKMARDTAGEIGGRIGEREGRNRTGNIPVISDIGGAIGRNKGRQQGQQTYDRAKETLGGLLKQGYEYDEYGYEIQESHFEIGDDVVCKKSGMTGEVVKVDKEEKGKYYTVKREDGKKVKYAPDELKLEGGNGGASKEAETKFHTKLDKLVHKTFGSSPEEKKMKEEYDNFDIILEYLIAEGYADTNENALVIMANMSEEWKKTILEAEVLAMKGGVPGSVRVKPALSIPGTSIGIGPNRPVPGTFTTTTPGQREKIKQGDTQIDRGIYKQSRVGAGPTQDERKRYNAELVRQDNRNAQFMRTTQ